MKVNSSLRFRVVDIGRFIESIIKGKSSAWFCFVLLSITKRFIAHAVKKYFDRDICASRVCSDFAVPISNILPSYGL